MFDSGGFHQSMWFTEEELTRTHPPVFSSKNKRIAHKIALPDDVALSTRDSRYVRWNAFDFEDVEMETDFPCEDMVDPVAGYYAYGGNSHGWKEWHVNFADPELFYGYGSHLFAQDEIMVAEHPVLASLREAVLGHGWPAKTSSRDIPSPVTITDIPRRCSIAIDANTKQGRPDGLYGHRFHFAKPEVVHQAVNRVVPPTYSNIIAMSSIPGGRGKYTAAEIRYLLMTAYSGFAAAAGDPHEISVINTGFWGCGAFGGNKMLMTLIQIAAASLANVQCLAMHYGEPQNKALIVEAIDRFDYELRHIRSKWLVSKLVDMGFEWGTPDGN